MLQAYCSEIVEKTVKEFGKITTLVNNAAKQGQVPRARAYVRCACRLSLVASRASLLPHVSVAYAGKAVGAISELSYERVAETFTVNILSFFETSKVRSGATLTTQ